MKVLIDIAVAFGAVGAAYIVGYIQGKRAGRYDDEIMIGSVKEIMEEAVDAVRSDNEVTRIMDLSDEELRAELMASGRDPDQMLREVDEIIEKVRTDMRQGRSP